MLATWLQGEQFARSRGKHTYPYALYSPHAEGAFVKYRRVRKFLFQSSPMEIRRISF